jgi:iron(III) transport system substrate-binding protein
MKKIFLSLSLLALLSNTTQAAEQNLNIYSARHYSVDKNLYDTFTKQTGIKVNLIEGEGPELMKRLELEGKNSPADILLTVDAGLLWKADQQKLFQPIKSDILNSRIPEDVRAKDGSWYAFAKRARVIIYDKTKGKPEGLDRYEDLAKPAYKGMVCVRTSNNLYNQSLLTTIIKADGEAAAIDWVKGFVANFARSPQANDVAQIKGVAAGVCRVAVVNSY